MTTDIPAQRRVWETFTENDYFPFLRQVPAGKINRGVKAT